MSGSWSPVSTLLIFPSGLDRMRAISAMLVQIMDSFSKLG